MSFAQEGLWFLDQFMGPTGAYNVTLTLRLTGPLDVAALDRSIGSLVARHASLRTAFVQRDVNEIGGMIRALGITAQ